MRNHMAAGWFYSTEQIAKYFKGRISSLKPPKSRLGNPISVLRQLNSHQWLLFACGFACWVWDAVDFFTVSLSLTEIAEEFDVSNSDASWVSLRPLPSSRITVSLMLRSVGALTFGPLSDHYGCKWPMVVALALFVVLELASGFWQTMPQFLAVRSRDGVAMGGMYGPAASTALADLPYDSRGVLSGIYQNGYSIGYLLAAVFYRALVPTTVYGWRSLFWFAAGPPVLLIIFRLWMPETNQFIAAKAEREARARRDRREAIGQEELAAKSSGLAVFARETGSAVKQNWVLMIYMIVLMTGFNSCSHGSQDFFPTFLKTQAELNPTDVSIISIVGQLGSVTGGTILGFISTFSGRRLIMLIACVLGGALVPAYVLPRDLSLIAGAFFEQVFVGGVWGPVPIYLMELSPTALRATMVGLTYQLGNLASSAAATIQAVIGERFPLPDGPGGSDRFDYAKVIAVFMGAVWAYIFFFLLIGPEMSQEEREEEAKAVIARELGLWDDSLPLHAESKASE